MVRCMVLTEVWSGFKQRFGAFRTEVWSVSDGGLERFGRRLERFGRRLERIGGPDEVLLWGEVKPSGAGEILSKTTYGCCKR